MVGGKVIEARPMQVAAGAYPGHRQDVIRLWCVDKFDECAVYASADEAADVTPGDRIWWQSGKIYWTRDGAFVEREIRKIGYSFDPRSVPE